MPEPVSYVRFEPAHLDGAVSVARALEWPSYADPEATLAAFTAPGAITWVATGQGSVVGLAHLLTNGVVHAHLSLVGVLPAHRRRGIARRLLSAAFEESGAKWLDLCAEAGSEAFYRSFRHQVFQGFRIHPGRS